MSLQQEAGCSFSEAPAEEPVWDGKRWAEFTRAKLLTQGLNGHNLLEETPSETYRKAEEMLESSLPDHVMLKHLRSDTTLGAILRAIILEAPVEEISREF